MASDLEQQVSKLETRLSGIEAQLEDLKALLVLLVEKFGATTTEIGTVLDVDRSQISRKYPTSNVKTAKVEVTGDG